MFETNQLQADNNMNIQSHNAVQQLISPIVAKNIWNRYKARTLFKEQIYPN